MTQRRLCLRKPAARIVPLLLCLTTAFCTSHDDSSPEQTAHAGAGIRALAATPIVIATGTKAGYLPGTSAVTPAGEFTYRIPLDVPPGRAGVEPELALAYASRSGNGLLGAGWELDGFSEIHRCGKTFSQEGASDGIDFDDDSLCLDGRKLVARSSAGGMTEYRTEQDELSRVVAYDAGAGPSRFVVYRKDGRIREYSAVTAKHEEHKDIDRDSDIDTVVTDVVLVWLLFSERDRAGNEIRYEYNVEIEGRSPYAIEYHPSAIQYTFQRHNNDVARRKVAFSYEERPDPTFTYVSGVKVQTTKRLRTIEMHAPNPSTPALVWRYALTYNSDTFRSHLAAVNKCGALGSCLLAKQFHYGDPSYPHFVQAYETTEAAAGGIRLVLDADGDGKDDLLYQETSKKFYLRKTPPDAPPLSLRLPVRGTSLANVSVEDTKPVDIDADGVVEVSGLVSKQQHQFFRWNGKTEEFQSVWKPIAVSKRASCESWPEPAYFIDVNGDALPDMVKTVDTNPAGPVWHYWLNQGDSFGAPLPIARNLDPPFCYTDADRGR